MRLSKGARKRRLRVLAHQEHPLIVGLDLAKKTHVAALMDRDRALLSRPVRIAHCRARVEAFVDHAEQVRQRCGRERVDGHGDPPDERGGFRLCRTQVLRQTVRWCGARTVPATTADSRQASSRVPVPARVILSPGGIAAEK